MRARLIAYLPEHAAATHVCAAEERLTIGRGEDAGFRLDHPSISRRHAELSHDAGRWVLADQRSKNGTFVDGRRIEQAALDANAWLRFGDVYCEYSLLTDDEAARLVAEQRRRQDSAQALSAGIARHSAFGDLVDTALRAVVDLAQCDRGFVLLADPEGLAVRARVGLTTASFTSSEFSGSVGAVQRSLARVEPVVSNDVSTQPWLSGRPSIIAAGVKRLLCVPLIEDGRAVGAVYADSRSPGPAITDVDLELLRAFVERAALCLTASRVERSLANDSVPRWEHVVARHAASTS